ETPYGGGKPHAYGLGHIFGIAAMPKPAKRRLKNEAVLAGDKAFEGSDIARLRQTHQFSRFRCIAIGRRCGPACRFSGAVRHVHQTQTVRDTPPPAYSPLAARIKLWRRGPAQVPPAARRRGPDDR